MVQNCINVMGRLIASFSDYVNPPWFISSHLKVLQLDLACEKVACRCFPSYSTIGYWGFFPSKFTSLSYFWAIQHLCVSLLRGCCSFLTKYILNLANMPEWIISILATTNYEGWSSTVLAAFLIFYKINRPLWLIRCCGTALLCLWLNMLMTY